jgi:hypothetical protein
MFPNLEEIYMDNYQNMHKKHNAFSDLIDTAIGFKTLSLKNK